MVDDDAVKLRITGADPLGAVARSQPGHAGVIFTTSKFDPAMLPSLARSLSFHRASGVPWKKRLLPLSARIKPYFFIAVRITWLLWENFEMSNPAFNRMRIPI